MELYVGLDVSMDETSICVVDRNGKIIKECKAATDPTAIHSALKAYADHLQRIGLEAQLFSPWLSRAVGNGIAGNCRRSRPYAEGSLGPAQ